MPVDCCRRVLPLLQLCERDGRGVQSSHSTELRAGRFMQKQAQTSAFHRYRFRVRLHRVCLLVCLLAAATTSAQLDDYSKGQQAYAAGSYRQAADLFARVVAAEIASTKYQSDAGLMLAKSLLHAANPSQAEAALRAYMSQHPASAPSFYLLARVLQVQNRPRESLAALTDAARLVHPTGEDLRIASLDYVLLNDYGDALRWSKRAVASEPGNAEAWYDLARVQMHDGRYDEAINALERSLALRPDSAKALDNLGVCLENQNRNDDALAAYARAVRATAATEHPSALPYRDQGKLLLTRNTFAQAAPLLLRSTELDGADASTFAALASAYVGLQQPAAARAAMERAVVLDPKNPRLHYQLARIYRSMGEAALAQREFAQSAAMYGNTSAE